MTGAVYNRPAISRFADINLRLFIDTNVLIDYAEGFTERDSMKFVDLFRANDFKHIDLVTSDYVLWEFYGHFREEFYIKKLVTELHYGYVSANKKCNRGKYEKATLKDMETFGKEIDKYEKSFDNSPVTIERLIGKDNQGFSDMVEVLLQCSKFSYKDSIIFVSALFTNSSLIITHDQTFSCDNHLEELKEALSNLKEPLKVELDFKRPSDFSTPELVKRNYQEWFIAKNKDKAIGFVTKIWPRKKIAAIQCVGENFIRIGDYLCLVKFEQNNNCLMSIFEVKKGTLQDYSSEEKISEGKKVTLCMPVEGSLNVYVGAMVFLYSYESVH